MKITWTKGLVEPQKSEVKALYQANAVFRERQKVIIQEKIDSIRKRNVIENAYDSPNWALKQADAVGYERALQEIINIL